MDWKFWTVDKWKARAKNAEQMLSALNLDRVELVQTMAREKQVELARKDDEFAKLTKYYNEVIEERNNYQAQLKVSREANEKLRAKEEKLKADLDNILADALKLAKDNDEWKRTCEAHTPVKLWLAKRPADEEGRKRLTEQVNLAFGSITEEHPLWKALVTVLVSHWWINHLSAAGVAPGAAAELARWHERRQMVEDLHAHFAELIARGKDRKAGKV